MSTNTNLIQRCGAACLAGALWVTAGRPVAAADSSSTQGHAYSRTLTFTLSTPSNLRKPHSGNAVAMESIVIAHEGIERRKPAPSPASARTPAQPRRP
jgi:hypothetical protein